MWIQVCRSEYHALRDWHVAKGAGHKYLKRVPTGKLTKTGKPRYRYYYKVSGGAGHLLNDEHLATVGAAHRVGDKGGHVHVLETHGGGHVTIEHDETKRRERVHVDDLRQRISATHKDALTDHDSRVREQASRDFAAAKQHGTPKQVAAAERRAKGAGVEASGVERAVLVHPTDEQLAEAKTLVSALVRTEMRGRPASEWSRYVDNAKAAMEQASTAYGAAKKKWRGLVAEHADLVRRSGGNGEKSKRLSKRTAAAEAGAWRAARELQERRAFHEELLARAVNDLGKQVRTSRSKRLEGLASVLPGEGMRASPPREVFRPYDGSGARRPGESPAAFKMRQDEINGRIARADADTKSHQGLRAANAGRVVIAPASSPDAAWFAADAAWSAELKRQFGRSAGDARYDERGKSTPELARLHAALRSASDARQARKDGETGKLNKGIAPEFSERLKRAWVRMLERITPRIAPVAPELALPQASCDRDDTNWPPPALDPTLWRLSQAIVTSRGELGTFAPLAMAHCYAGLTGEPIVEIPAADARAIETGAILKAGPAKYVRKVWAGTRWRYYYNAAHGGGVGNSEHIKGGEKGTHFKMSGEHYKVHSVEDGHVTYHKVGDPAALQKTKVETLTSALNAAHGGELKDHYEGKHGRLKADAAKAEALGNKKHATRLHAQAEAVKAEAESRGVKGVGAKSATPEGPGWKRTAHGEHSADVMEAAHGLAAGVRPSGSAAAAARRAGLMAYDKASGEHVLTDKGKAAIAAHEAEHKRATPDEVTTDEQKQREDAARASAAKRRKGGDEGVSPSAAPFDEDDADWSGGGAPTAGPAPEPRPVSDPDLKAEAEHHDRRLHAWEARRAARAARVRNPAEPTPEERRALRFHDRKVQEHANALTGLHGDAAKRGLSLSKRPDPGSREDIVAKLKAVQQAGREDLAAARARSPGPGGKTAVSSASTHRTLKALEERWKRQFGDEPIPGYTPEIPTGAVGFSNVVGPPKPGEPLPKPVDAREAKARAAAKTAGPVTGPRKERFEIGAMSTRYGHKSFDVSSGGKRYRVEQLRDNTWTITRGDNTVATVHMQPGEGHKRVGIETIKALEKHLGVEHEHGWNEAAATKKVEARGGTHDGHGEFAVVKDPGSGYSVVHGPSGARMIGTKSKAGATWTAHQYATQLGSIPKGETGTHRLTEAQSKAEGQIRWQLEQHEKSAFAPWDGAALDADRKATGDTASAVEAFKKAPREQIGPFKPTPRPHVSEKSIKRRLDTFRSKDRADIGKIGIDPKSGRAFASDGHRLAIVPAGGHLPEGALGGGEGHPSVKLIDGVTPAHSQAATHYSSADLASLVDAVKGDKSKHFVRFTGGKAELASEFDGPAMASLDGAGPSSDATSVVNAQYLADALSGSTGTVRIQHGAGEHGSPVRHPIRIDREDGETHVMMPYMKPSR